MILITWLLVGLYLFAIFGQLLLIDKPREPLTTGSAMFGALTGSVTIMLLLYWMFTK